MITIFNRKEVLLTYSMKEQADIRKLLSCNRINFITRTRNSLNYSRGRVGGTGWNTETSYEYKIYVNRKDYARAKEIIMHFKD